MIEFLVKAFNRSPYGLELNVWISIVKEELFPPVVYIFWYWPLASKLLNFKIIYFWKKT